MKLEPMKPAPPVTKIVCRISISLHRGDHAGMPRGCHLPGKRSIVIKKDGLSPFIPPVQLFGVAAGETCGKLVEYLLQQPLRNLKANARPCITAGTKLVSDAASNPRLKLRRWRIFGAAVLIAALGIVVIYTSQGAFLSPVALVVVAAIGLAAVLMQLRLRQGPTASGRAPLWLNVLGIIFALAAVFADVLRLNPSLTLLTALGAVLCFATSGVVVLAAIRKQRT